MTTARRAVGRWLRALPRPHTLRARLTAGLVVLLAVSCAAVGVAAVIELDGFLTGRLDQQLTEVGTQFPASLEHKGQTLTDHDADDRERGDTRRQAPGTFGARLVDGTVTNAAVVPADKDDTTTDLKVTLSGRDRGNWPRCRSAAGPAPSASRPSAATASWPRRAGTAT